MPPSEILAPTSLHEALALASRHGEKAKIMGGGTDLIVQIKKNAVDPGMVISLENVAEIDFISHEESGLHIGAMTAVSTIEKAPMVRNRCSMLSEAAAQLANPLIRRKATIGGNLCNASPAADLAPALLALGARLKIQNAAGERVVEIEDFFVGPGKTVLKPDEILTRIIIPDPAPHAKGVYLKNKRSGGADLSIVGVAVLTTMHENTIQDIRIGLGAVAPTPIRARETENRLRGRVPSEGILEEVCLKTSAEACCISDVRCTADYRNKIIAVYLKRAILQTAGMADLN
jgi:aerobic carbon-monoxide dehydrogenase medium subunit